MPPSFPPPKPQSPTPLKRRLRFLGVALLVGVTLPLVAAWIILSQPSLRSNEASSVTVDPARLEATVRLLAETHAPRSYGHRANLSRIADHLASEFETAGGRVERQRFRHSGLYEFQNVSAHFGPLDPSLPRVVAGAHYDAFENSPGADDNASGVAGVVELARLLGNVSPGEFAHPIELVCWPLEEPPFFRTQSMGSAQHAARLQESGTELKLMISLEMIGYFSDESGSQDYPMPLLHLFYPDRGNFIAVAGNLQDRKEIALAKASMRGSTPLPVHSISAPPNLPGIDFSDHLNYWAHGYPAIMITDTAFYRNQRYHTQEDTPDTLDYERMSQVVVATFELLQELAFSPEAR